MLAVIHMRQLGSRPYFEGSSAYYQTIRDPDKSYRFFICSAREQFPVQCHIRPYGFAAFGALRNSISAVKYEIRIISFSA